MPNHVAELESTVTQLQATVDGLREELVDANERIRILERELEMHDENIANNENTGNDQSDSFMLPPPGSEENTQQEGLDDAEEMDESTNGSADDIIIA